MSVENCSDCNHSAKVYYNVVKGFWAVDCNHCPTGTWDETEEKAIKRWNEAMRKNKTQMKEKKFADSQAG